MALNRWTVLSVSMLLVNTTGVLMPINQTLAACETISELFYNTCDPSDGAFPSVADIPGEKVSCFEAASCVSGGVSEDGVCTWERRLCVTCSEGADGVYIRVQSNGLPAACYTSPKDIGTLDIDYEVRFNTDVRGSMNAMPDTQEEVDSTLCTVGAHNAVPDYCNNTSWGVTKLRNGPFGNQLDGVLQYTAVDEGNADPYYPTSGVSPNFDVCLGHPAPNTNIYHYHMMAPCVVDPDICGSSCITCQESDTCSTSYIAQGLKGFLDSQTTTATVIGVAQDGHVMFGPYDDSGNLWDGLDVCNGKMIDTDGDGDAETYAYFATTAFPYTSGCFGPGNYPSYLPQCTSNPPSGYPTGAHDLSTTKEATAATHKISSENSILSTTSGKLLIVTVVVVAVALTSMVAFFALQGWHRRATLRQEQDSLGAAFLDPCVSCKVASSVMSPPRAHREIQIMELGRTSRQPVSRPYSVPPGF